MNVKSVGGSRYFITFIDDMSRQIFVYFIKEKGQVFETFKMFKAMVENQTNKKIKVLRSDNGGEYISKQFDDFLKENGIKRQLTVPHTPQQNGIAERANRTLVEMARSMIVHANLEEYFWAEAISTAAYIRNRSLTKIHPDMTPQEIWSGKKPTVAHFKIFGSVAVALDKTENKKFRAKGKEYIMVGYSDEAKGYRLYDMDKKIIIVRRDVIFIENELERKSSLNENAVLIELESTEDQNVINLEIEEAIISSIPSEDNSHDSEVHESDDEENFDRSTDTRAKVGRGRPKVIRSGKPGRPKKQYNILNVMSEDIRIPQTVNEAINGPYAKEWIEAMKKEYNALIENETWSVVELPQNQKAIGSKWVFTLKKDKEGKVERFKARLVAKGCSQKYGINYDETFSPVIRYANLRLLIAIAVEHKLYMHQMDVTTAYLNGDLHDDVFMKQPEYFETKSANIVLKLKKSLYGLKQSGREWNLKLDNVLKEIGFVPCESEPCLYTRHEQQKLNFIAVYVDDLILACSDKHDLDAIKHQISSKFKIVDQGPLNYFLGMEVERDGETGAITLCQKKYINEMLTEYNMQDCKPMSTPLDEGFQLKCISDTCKKVDATKYQSLIGTLMYLALTTRPDILHSVCKLSQRNKDPHIEHETAAKHIIRYLSKTKDLKMHYFRTGKPIQGFVDADWGGDPIERKSYTGYVFFYGGSAFSWESKKQATVALSSTEAEYIAFCAASKEAVYLNKLCLELGVINSKIPIVINGDNLSAQQLIKNPVYHARSKHIDIKYHYVREVYKNNEINLNYVPTNDMIADVLTKNLARIKHCKFTNLMGLN